jgi:hypothetical protein
MEVSQEKRFSTAKEMQKALRKAFSQMQEAMSAQTIAFAAPEVHSSKIEQPVGAMHSLPGDKLGDADSKATQLRDELVEPERFPAVSVPQTSDASAHYTGPTDTPVRQADVKTEVYNAGSNPLYVPDEPAPTPTSHDFTPAASKAEDWSVTTDNQNGDFPAPDATVANLDLGASSPASPYGANETFSSPAPSSADAFATGVPDETPDVPVNSPPRPAPVVVQKKKSKAVWVVGGLAVLFFMGIVAAGAGWFVYSQYYASAAVAPTPSPEPTFAATPTPEPTFEAVTNSNSNSSIATLDSNSNTNTEVLTVQPTPTPLSQTETATREPNPGVKQTQQTDTKKTTPVKTSTPVAAKPTPKKSDRTVILQ